jgi:U4/U6.U5 tri-snRNP-associated protein 1
MEGFDFDAINKQRLSLGLAPIPVPGVSDGPVFKDAKDDSPAEEPASTLESRQAAANENWRKLHEEQLAKGERLKRKESAMKAREAAMRQKEFVGKTLAEDDENLDTRTWLMQQRKRQKKIEKAERLAAELAAREQQAQYTSADLKGVKVGHEIGEFDVGTEQILTLKDQIIGEESEEDELENIELRAKERLQKKLESKKRKPAYNPNDDDGMGEKKILAQYDEEIEGEKRHQFTLDGRGKTVEELQQIVDDSKVHSNGMKISLAAIIGDTQTVSDYKDAPEIVNRKPKKVKKDKTKRKKTLDDRGDDEDEILSMSKSNKSAMFENGQKIEAMDVDTNVLTESVGNLKKRSFADTNLVDDDDLQLQLAKQRREALKKRKKTNPEDLAKQLREVEENEMVGVLQSVEDGDESQDVLIDSTVEFVTKLDPSKVKEDEEEEDQRRKSKETRSHLTSEVVAAASDEEDEIMQDPYDYSRRPSEVASSERATSTPAQETTSGFTEEATLNAGIGSTVNMLRSRGILENATSAEESQRYIAQQKFLAQKARIQQKYDQRAREQRERDRRSGLLDRMSHRERDEYAQRQNQEREQAVSRELAQMFNREYKPDVKLTYIDEFGRSMNQKEAFKHLSHQFHGKTSGNQKHEKRLKKIAEEKRKEAKPLLDSTEDALAQAGMGDKAKKDRHAGIRLQ